MCSEIKTPNFRLVEVLCDSAAKTIFPLATDQVLQSARQILGVEAYKVGDVTISPLNQADVVADDIFKKSYLTLITRDGEVEVISKIPLADLCRSANDGVLQQFSIPPINVTKCYITVATNDELAVDTVWLLGFHYAK